MNSLVAHIIQNELHRKGVTEYVIEDNHIYNPSEIELSACQFAVVYAVVGLDPLVMDIKLTSALQSVQYNTDNSLIEGSERQGRLESDLISVHYSRLKVKHSHPILLKYALITY